MAQKPAIIIDNGSYTTKAGFAGDEGPKTEFVTIVGRPRHQNVPNLDPHKRYIGDELEAMRAVLMLKYPVERGIIDKWDEIEKIWQHGFEQLKVPSEEHPVFLTETANNPKATREKMAEVMMEKFNTPALFIGIQGVLSLYAVGRQTGVTLNIGEGLTQVTPVDKGYAIPGASTCLKLGGHDLRLNLGKLLHMESRYEALNHYRNSLEHCRNMVEKLCYVALDFEKEMESPPKKTKAEEESYELPCGSIITLQDEKFRCPELLFKPSLLGNLNENNIEEGIHKICFDTISKCDFEIHPLLYKSIALSGGCTMFRGFPARFEKEIRELVPDGTKVKVIAPDVRKNSVWIGASVLGSLATFKDMCVTKEQYLEQGSSAIHKCPSA